MFFYFCQILDNSLWSQEINIPSGNEIRYRYFVCSVDEVTQGLHVRRWETHLKPRIIPAISQNGDRTESIDTFGEINGVEKIDRGWLTSETILQFKFFNNPFKVKEKLKNKILFVKVRFFIFYTFFFLIIISKLIKVCCL